MGAYSFTMTMVKAATEVSWGGIAWTNPDKAGVEDGVYATNDLNALEKTEYINCDQLSGLISLPALAQITGILVELLGYADTDDVLYISEGWLSDGSVQQGSSVAASKPITTTEGWGEKGSYYGGDGEMFGLSSAQLKSLITQKFFGCQYLFEEITGGGPYHLEIDSARITVFYDLPRLFAVMGAGR